MGCKTPYRMGARIPRRERERRAAVARSTEERRGLFKVHCQPDTGLFCRGPGDPVAAMGWNIHVVAGN